MSFYERRGQDSVIVKALRSENDYLPAPLDLRLALPAVSLWLTLLVLVDAGLFTSVVVSAGSFLAAALVFGFSCKTKLGSTHTLRSFLSSRRGGCHSAYPRGSAGSMLLLVALTLGLVFGTQVIRLVLLNRDNTAVIGADPSRSITATAQVISTPHHNQFGNTYLTDLVLHQLTWRGNHYPTRAKIQVKGGGWGNIELGSWVRLRFKLTHRDPSGQYLGFGKSLEPPEVVSPPSGRYRLVNHARHQLAQINASLPADTTALILAMTLGYKSVQSQSDRQAMQCAGLTHLTAVSGMHLSVVVAAGLGITARQKRSTQIITAALFMSGFLTVLPGSPAIARAGTMGVITLIGLALARPARSLSSLFLAVLVILTVSPWQASSWGFTLSVVTTAAIVTLGRQLTNWLSYFLPKFVVLPLAVSLAAQLACAPLMLGMRGKLQIWALPANLLASAAGPVVTIGGLLLIIWGTTSSSLPDSLHTPGTAISQTLDSVSYLLSKITGIAADWILAVARFFSSTRGCEIPWLNGFSGIIAILTVTFSLIWVLYRLSQRARWQVGKSAKPWLPKHIQHP